MRKFLPERPDDQQNLILVKQLRTNKPLMIYARRSDPTAKDAKKDRTQSREMQTDDMLLWGKRSGWPENLLYPYFADLGLSGTLRPDQRPDMLRIFDDLDSGKFDGGTLACWQENRPFRDETHIYYNQLIEKMLQHDVVLVVLSPRLYIYDMRDPFDKERLREKFKEAADFIPKHVKGWLHPARERAAWEDDEWAGLGDLPPGFICDYDPQSPTYKHAIPYWPHIEKVKEHFELYMEVSGEISLFNQHLRRSPIIFPEFDPKLDRRVASKWKMSKYPGGGYYIRTPTALISMLTNPIYSGYRFVKGVIRRDPPGK
ncbi:MAG: recombinase family protein [Ktedonobacteraceae bacterium]|nr:recombinase family protein [Ktedonobacteraceae bacterium]